MDRFKASSATTLLTTSLFLAMLLLLFTVESFAFKRMMLLEVKGNEQRSVHTIQSSKLVGPPKASENTGGNMKCEGVEGGKKCEVDDNNEFLNGDYIYTNFKPGH